MKSRVSRNQELHTKIASDLESDVQNSDLSHFANRLNRIDDQFDKMESVSKENIELTHARSSETIHINPTAKINKDDQLRTYEEQQFDTFESSYLKDFLDEVKEYNVKKGYRKVEDTNANIISELNESGKIARPFKEEEMASVLKEIDPILSENISNLANLKDSNASSEKFSRKSIDEDDQQKTIVFSATDPLDEESSFELEKTIAMAVQEMVEYDHQDDDVLNSDQPELESIEISNKIESNLDDNLIEENIAEFDTDKFKEALLSQTQSLKTQIKDQEENIDNMNEMMDKTNRMLNIVLSLLIIAIVVVGLLIVVSSGIIKF